MRINNYQNVRVYWFLAPILLRLPAGEIFEKHDDQCNEAMSLSRVNHHAGCLPGGNVNKHRHGGGSPRAN